MDRCFLLYILALVSFWVLLLYWGKPHSNSHSPKDDANFHRDWWRRYTSADFSTVSNWAQIPGEARKAVVDLLHGYNSGTHPPPHDGEFKYNVTGFLHGTWEAHVCEDRNEMLGSGALSSPLPRNEGLDRRIPPLEYTLPLNNSQGRVYASLQSRRSHSSLINHIDGSFQFANPYYHLNLVTEGIHWVQNGTIMMYGSVARHADYPFGVLRAMPDQTMFSQAKSVLGMVYHTRLPKQPRYEDVEHNCEFQVYVQLSPTARIELLAHDDPRLPDLSPDSLMNNTHRHEPASWGSAVFYSPNCNVLFVMPSPLTGIRMGKFLRKSLDIAGFSVVVSLVQLILLVRQIDYTYTPSRASRASYYAFVTQAVYDSYICLINMTAMFMYDDLFFPFGAATVFAFILLLFSGKYLVFLHDAHWPGLRNHTPGRHDLTKLYIRMFFIMTGGIFVIYLYAGNNSFWPTAAIWLLTFFLSSSWVFQIVHNIARGTNHGVRAEYMVGSTVLRLMLPLYAFGCPNNIFFFDTTPALWMLCSWVGVQVSVLLSQDLFGSRFMVPKSFLSPTYDYHPTIHASDEEAAQGAPAEMSSDIGSGDGTQQQQYINLLESTACAICLQVVDLPAANSTMVIDRSSYMLTPCHHLFHTCCLEPWMDIKLECPICRNPLPPV